MDDNRLARIRDRAHEIWEREGRPHGQHDAHWAQAEAEIDAEDAAGNTAPAEGIAPEAAPAAKPKGRSTRGTSAGKAEAAGSGLPGMTEGTTRRSRTGDTTRSKDAAPAKASRKAATTGKAAEGAAETAAAPKRASKGAAAKPRGKNASV